MTTVEERLPRSHTPALPRILLFCILLLGIALRVMGLRWGLPNAEHLYSYHPDEIPILGAVLQVDVFSGHLNPHFFNYGTLYIYLIYFAYLIALGTGLVAAGPQVPAYEQLAQLHLVGRGVTVFFGVATILLTYFLARRITGQSGALLAAFLMAVVPGHVANSHYATVDVTLTFWVTLALLSMTHIESAEDRKWVFWSGLVVGLATATKYSAGLLVVPLSFQCWRVSSHRRDAESAEKKPDSESASSLRSLRLCGAMFKRVLLLALAGTVLGFVIGCPFSLLAFPEFKRDFLFELHHSQTGSGLIFQGTGNGWWYHVAENLPYAVGVPWFFIAIGFVWGIRVRNREPDSQRLLVLLWTLLILAVIGYAKIRFQRYLLPTLPCLVVLLADMLTAAVRWDIQSERELKETMRAWKWARTPLYPSLAVPLAIAVMMLYSGLNAAHQFCERDPRNAAARWLKPQLHTGSTIGLINVPWFYTPPICSFNGGMKSQRQFEEWNGTALYRITVTGWDRQKLEKSPPDYFITSEFETRDELRLKLNEQVQFLKLLSEKYDLVKTFKNKQPTALFAPKFVPHDWLYPNPEIRIYRKKL